MRVVCRLPYLVIFLIILLPGGANGQTGLACSTDRPIVGPDGRLRLQVYRDRAETKQLMWTVSKGEIVSQGSDTYWIVPHQLTPGERLLAKVTERDSQRSCSVSVISVDDDPVRRPLTPSWFPLKPDGPPLPKYGLYSYILLGSVPSKSLRPTILSALDAYIGFAPFLDEMRRYIKNTEDINITLVPARSIPEKITSETLLDNYDFAAAKAIMRKIDGLKSDGIYLVSSLDALHGSGNAKTRLAAVQELSRVPPNVTGLWIREFLSQTSAEQQWNPPALRSVVLYLRTTIAVLGEGLPEVRKGVIEWIKIKGE